MYQLGIVTSKNVISDIWNCISDIWNTIVTSENDIRTSNNYSPNLILDIKKRFSTSQNVIVISSFAYVHIQNEDGNLGDDNVQKL